MPEWGCQPKPKPGPAASGQRRVDDIETDERFAPLRSLTGSPQLTSRRRKPCCCPGERA